MNRPPEATHWDINKILQEAQAGNLQVPVFQRNFCWRPEDILNLFDSLYKGYPIGNLVLWRTTPTGNTRATFGASSFKQKRPAEAWLIIDGQQRITSLVGALLAPPEGTAPIREFCVYFDLNEQRFKHPRTGRAVPAHWLPMTEVADTVAFLEWLQDANLSSDQVRRANLVVRSLRDYRLPAYLVVGGPEQEHLIREIFSRLNTTGRRLKQAEIFRALHGDPTSGPSDRASRLPEES